MDKKNKGLLIKLLSSFFTLLIFCLAIALLINLKFRQDCATVIVGMLGVCATLYAPVAAFFFYDSWKDQKQYELEKQYAEDILMTAISIHDELTREYYSFLNFISYMQNKLIAINGLYSSENMYNYSKAINDTSAKFELLQSVLNKKINKSILDNFEYSVICLNSLNNTMKELYEDYYKLLPDDMKNSNTTKTLSKKTNNNLLINKLKIEESEKIMVSHFSKNIRLELNLHYKGNYIYYEKTHTEYKEMLDEAYKNIAELLIQKIKIKKSSSS